MNAINAQAIADYLIDLIEQDDQPWSDDGDKPTVRSFEEAGVLTTQCGSGPSRSRWAGIPDQRGQVPLRPDSQGWPFARGTTDPRRPGRQPGSESVEQQSLSLALFLEESSHEDRP